MVVSHLKVQNFRIHDSFEFDLHPETTVITGLNGSGKTSLVEAIYIALRGSSFKGTDPDIVKSDSSWYRIDVGMTSGVDRIVKYSSGDNGSKKVFEINSKKHGRLPTNCKYPIVIFEPDDLQLFKGSPARRRRFIDNIIANIDPGYQTILNRYDRSLKQRNAALKINADKDSLFAWNISISDYGEKIITNRMKYIDLINQRLSEVYRQVSGQKDDLHISYSFNSSIDVRQLILSELERNTDRDRLLGYTSIGPHRHDINFIFNSGDMKKVASRGEARSAVIAIKFIEVKIIEENLGVKPLVILDDVYSELDDIRKKHITNYMSGGQVIITGIINSELSGQKIISLK